MQFVNFTEIMSKSIPSDKRETEFALAALMEIPSQYKATIDLQLLGYCSAVLYVTNKGSMFLSMSELLHVAFFPPSDSKRRGTKPRRCLPPPIRNRDSSVSTSKYSQLRRFEQAAEVRKNALFPTSVPAPTAPSQSSLNDKQVYSISFSFYPSTSY